MKITTEIEDYSTPAKPKIRVHNSWFQSSSLVELEVEGKRYTVKGSELISAIQKCMLDCFGE